MYDHCSSNHDHHILVVTAKRECKMSMIEDRFEVDDDFILVSAKGNVHIYKHCSLGLRMVITYKSCRQISNGMIDGDHFCEASFDRGAMRLLCAMGGDKTQAILASIHASTIAHPMDRGR